MNLKLFSLLISFLIPIVFTVDHAFIYKINKNGSKKIKDDGNIIKTQIKKVFVDLIIDGRIYRRKEAKGKREVDKYFHYEFSCKHCEEYNKFTSCRVLTEIVDIDDPV